MGAYQLRFVVICYHHNKFLPYKHTWMVNRSICDL